jgi:hypothetical protein
VPARKKTQGAKLRQIERRIFNQDHLACDALRNAVRFILSGGECSNHR